MRCMPRLIEPEPRAAARNFSALILIGPRRAGKTTLLRRAFPTATYRLLEDPDTLARVRADPRTFLSELRPPVILDEIQNTPEILNYVRAAIDRAPTKKGRWLLTGSQEAPLMHGVTESIRGIGSEVAHRWSGATPVRRELVALASGRRRGPARLEVGTQHHGNRNTESCRGAEGGELTECPYSDVLGRTRTWGRKRRLKSLSVGCRWWSCGA